MKESTACIIVNCTVIIAFAVLAYLFGKWWIVLLSVLCMVKTKKGWDEI